MNRTRTDKALTRGERLELNRRRKRQTQDETAAEFGVTTYVYRRWENDRHRTPPVYALEEGPRDYEWCYVLRKRAGLTLRVLGERMGLSHKWIHRAERGEVRDVTALVLWWEQEAKRA